MDLMTMILGGTGALAGAVAVRVIASDIGDNVPVLAKRLIIRAAKRLPGAENTRYQEEWLAHLNECRGSIPKLLHAIKCLTCARNLQRILAAPNSVSPVFEAGALFSIIDNTPEMGATIAKLRDLLNVDHLVYHSMPLGASPSADPYIRLTYPASWIKRYLQMEYLDNDPVVREGLLRTLPFVWSELKIQSAAEASFLADALAHGVGPYGLSIPVQSKHGHRALFSISFSRSEKEWINFLKTTQPTLIEIANRVHRRVIGEVFGEDRPHLTMRELECLRWIARGKDTSEIAVILNISSHTARDYLRSARYKLDCVSSEQAVSKAVKLGLLIL